MLTMGHNCTQLFGAKLALISWFCSKTRTNNRLGDREHQCVKAAEREKNGGAARHGHPAKMAMAGRERGRYAAPGRDLRQKAKSAKANAAAPQPTTGANHPQAGNRCRHSGATKTYVTQTAVIHRAGMSVMTKGLRDKTKWTVMAQRVKTESAWLHQAKYLQMTLNPWASLRL